MQRSTTGQILTIRRLIEGIKALNLKATILFVDFSKAFDSIGRSKLEDILSAYGILCCSIDLNKSLGFTLHKWKSRRYPAVKLTGADYTDDLALFADKCSDAEKLLHLLEYAAEKVGLKVNAKKTEYIN